MNRAIGLLALAVSLLTALIAWHGARGPMRVMLSMAVGAVLLLAVPLSIAMASASTTVADIELSHRGISIFSWNTSQISVDEVTLERAMALSGADIVVLPEYFGETAKTVLAQWAKDHQYRAYSQDSSTSSVFVKRSLGRFTVSTKGVPPWAGFVLLPSSASGPTLGVVHIQRGDLLDDGTYAQHLKWIETLCANPDVIVVGDMNTPPEGLQGIKLGGCRDVSATLGSAASGTWPTALPAALGTQIDRILVGHNWSPIAFGVVGGYDHAGSDHRPIVGVVRSDQLVAPRRTTGG